MMLKRLFVIIALVLGPLLCRADFEFNANCVKAYQEIMHFRLDAARALVNAEKKNNPQNSIPYLLDNYIDYFTILASESKADFERLKNNKSQRLSRLGNDTQNSPWKLFAQAEVNLQWALLRGRFQEYVSSAMEINRAYSQLKDNAKKYPSFLPNNKGLGMINALLGSLPEGMRKTLSTLGIRGNTQSGLRMLESLVGSLPGSSYSYLYDETVFYLSIVQLDIVNEPSAYSKVIRNTQDIDSSSLLKTYIRSYAGTKTAHNNEAIAFLESRPSGSQYEPYPYLDYLLGKARMHKLDYSAAASFQKFLKNSKGVNYTKDALLNLAWIELLNGDMAGYNSYISRVKTSGYTYHDKDEQALKEASYPAPNTELLRARLLFDGGYYERAQASLADRKTDDFRSLRDKIEYCYRLGRIYDELQKDDFALKFYQFAYNLGKNERYYFASNAVLRMGIISEKKKNHTLAKSYYNTAINMKNHDYESSIETRAREGLRRIGG